MIYWHLLQIPLNNQGALNNLGAQADCREHHSTLLSQALRCMDQGGAPSARGRQNDLTIVLQIEISWIFEKEKNLGGGASFTKILG